MMERIDYENIVKLLPDDALVAFMMEVNATRLHDTDDDGWDELVDISYFGRRGYSEMTPDELRKLVVDDLVEYYEGDDEVDGEAVAETIDDNIRGGRALIEVVLEQKIMRSHEES